jgi:hypothetical protein
MPTFHFGVVAFWFPHKKRRSFAVQGIGRVGVPQELRKEDLEDVDHVVHWRPCLVDDVETDGAGAICVSRRSLIDRVKGTGRTVHRCWGGISCSRSRC